MGKGAGYLHFFLSDPFFVPLLFHCRKTHFSGSHLTYHSLPCPARLSASPSSFWFSYTGLLLFLDTTAKSCHRTQALANPQPRSLSPWYGHGQFSPFQVLTQSHFLRCFHFPSLATVSKTWPPLPDTFYPAVRFISPQYNTYHQRTYYCLHFILLLSAHLLEC